jgi:2-methylcitrate dehydratase PrpD
MIPVLEDLAKRADGFRLSDAARQSAIEAVLDTVTAAAAAPPHGFGTALREAYGAGPSVLWFTGEKGSPVAAGFANALASAALDLDDGHRASRGHPGAAVVPAVLAHADRLDSLGASPSDEAILRAIAIGYDIGLRIAAARSFYARTGFWGGFAAAAGAGALQGLAPMEMANALAIAGETGPHMATTTAPPAWPQPSGSHVKEGIPWGVATGLSAVPLAAAGMTGARDLVDHAPFFDADAILADRPGPAICESYTKFHAACRHVHAPVEALAALMADHGLQAAQIDAIHVSAYSGALRIPNAPRPRNLVDAQYSIPYCLALVALRGADALLPMSEADLHDRRAEAFAEKVSISIDPGLEARFPAETPVRLRVTCGERQIDSPVTTPSGDARDRPGWDMRLRKFRVATRDQLSPADREALELGFEELRKGGLGLLRRCLASCRAPFPAP